MFMYIHKNIFVNVWFVQKCVHAELIDCTAVGVGPTHFQVFCSLSSLIQAYPKQIHVACMRAATIGKRTGRIVSAQHVHKIP